MHGIGIDAQPGTTVVGLREGPVGAARTRIVGDGAREVIPNAAVPGGPWGSAAYRSGDGPADAEAFWDGLYQRVFDYLGYVPPNPRHGFQAVVAVTASPGSALWSRTEDLARGARFDDARLIPACDALLCRWLAAPGGAPHGPVVAVAVGEDRIQVAGYRVEAATVRADGGAEECESGARDWCEQLVQLVRERMTEPPTDGADDLLLRDAAREFAHQMTAQPPDATVPWSGAFRRRLYSIPTLSRAEVLGWPSAQLTAARLPEAVRRVAAAVGLVAGAGTCAVGGIGAAWPLVPELLGRHGYRVWRTQNPEYDVALGAALWPLFAPRFVGAVPPGLPRPPLPALPAAPDVPPAGREAEDGADPPTLPPWLRGNIDPDHGGTDSV